jgi:rare lipoprotein A
MYEMTAAHRVLPLPTYVEVTHLETGRKAIVRVNDRGPFKDDRILDLSFAAARRLGIDGPGTAWVEVRALSPGERRGKTAPDPIPVAERPMPVVRPVATARLEPAPLPETGLEPTARAPEMGGADRGLFLQVGAFTEAANAERFRARVLAMLAAMVGTGREPAVRIQPAERAERPLYRVQIGPFDGGEMAERVGARLSTAGLRSHRVTPAPF